jgi:purine-binding chemotaxis protein CheW
MENYSGAVPYLSFWLNDELYAYKVDNVVEVLELQKITVVPKSESYIMGVLNFRGEILPVIDVRKKCGLNSSRDILVEDSVIIVLNVNKEDTDNIVYVGSIVERVSDVIHIKPIDIVQIHEFDSKIDSSLTEGIYNYDGNFVTLLDVHKLFAINYLKNDKI